MAHKDRVGTEPWDIVLIRVLTDEGIEGNAFGWGVRSGEVTAKIVADVLKPAMVGEDPFDREKIPGQDAGRDHRRPSADCISFNP